MGGDIDPGDHHSMGWVEFIVFGESPVDDLGRPTQGITTGVLTEVYSALTVSCVQVSLQSCNHAKPRGHLAKIRRLAGWLRCGNKTIGVDLKLKAQVKIMGRTRNEMIVTPHDSPG